MSVSQRQGSLKREKGLPARGRGRSHTHVSKTQRECGQGDPGSALTMTVRAGHDSPGW